MYVQANETAHDVIDGVVDHIDSNGTLLRITVDRLDADEDRAQPACIGATPLRRTLANRIPLESGVSKEHRRRSNASTAVRGLCCR